MTKVGLIYYFDDTSWSGGVNYIQNLISAIYSLPTRQIEIVIITGKRTGGLPPKRFQSLILIRSRYLDKNSFWWIIRYLVKKIFKYDYFLDKICNRNQIKILSHSGYIGGSTKVICIGNIFDFQHKVMPELFEKKEILIRDKWFSNQIRYCNYIFVSSKTAEIDFKNYYSKYSHKVRVLSFVSAIIEQNNFDVSASAVLKKYSLSTAYFHLPNQFWKHKNHFVVIQAVKHLKENSIDVVVVATGNTHDYRNPNYFSTIIEYINKHSLNKNFIILGCIPMNELEIIMRQSIAIINPSLFEGWSTSVEEAKILNKQIILSTIPVHIEQAPERSCFFDPKNYKELSNILYCLKSTFDKNIEQKEYEKAKKKSTKAIQEYGARYQSIILNLLNNTK